MKKLKKIVTIVWLSVALVCVFWGTDSILNISTYGVYFSLIFTIGTIFVMVSVHSTETKKEVEKILLEAKELYSLNYSNLINIEKIELTSEHEYFVMLKNNFRFKLESGNVPHVQHELDLLDRAYEGMNNRIKVSEKENS